VVTNFSIRHLSYVLFRRRRLFFGTLVVALALYGGLILTQKSQYESQASIVVKVVDQDIANPDRLTEQEGIRASSFANLAKETINSVQVVVTSEDVLTNALSKVGIDNVYPRLKAKAAKNKIPLRNLATAQLLEDISVKVNTDTNVLTMSLYNTDPQIARTTLQSLITATVTKHASVMRDPRIQFLERKLQMLKKEADASQQAVLEFKQKAGISSFEEERTLLLRQRDSTQTSRNAIQADMLAATGRLGSLQDSLGRTSNTIALSDENDNVARQRDNARAALASAQARFEAARQRFREGNPELIDQEAQLKLAQEQYDKVSSESGSRLRLGVNPVAQALSQSSSTVKSDATGLKAALAERDAQLQQIDARIAYLNTNEIQVRELERRRDLAEREYRSYLERAQSARMVSDMNDAGITSLSVLQAPTLPYEPARPKKFLLLLMTLFVGFAGGLALCVFMESMDDTLALPEQVETAVGLPLLAVINQQPYDGAP
jgi:uncharacterized protein involved in exopolysaccharide biosynthesis